MGFKKLFLSALLFTSFFNQTSQAHDTSSVEGLRDLCVYQQNYYARSGYLGSSLENCAASKCFLT